MEEAMKRRKGKKSLGVLLLAGVLASGMTVPYLQAYAASPAETSGSYTKSGSFHIDQFGVKKNYATL